MLELNQVKFKGNILELQRTVSRMVGHYMNHCFHNIYPFTLLTRATHKLRTIPPKPTNQTNKQTKQRQARKTEKMHMHTHYLKKRKAKYNSLAVAYASRERHCELKKIVILRQKR